MYIPTFEVSSRVWQISGIYPDCAVGPTMADLLTLLLLTVQLRTALMSFLSRGRQCTCLQTDQATLIAHLTYTNDVYTLLHDACSSQRAFADSDHASLHLCTTTNSIPTKLHHAHAYTPVLSLLHGKTCRRHLMTSLTRTTSPPALVPFALPPPHIDTQC